MFLHYPDRLKSIMPLNSIFTCLNVNMTGVSKIVNNSRVIFGPPVTTESRGRFESGFGYFEVF